MHCTTVTARLLGVTYHSVCAVITSPLMSCYHLSLVLSHHLSFCFCQPCNYNQWTVATFYRAMHCSAKCGLAVACCSTVRLAETLMDQDHIGCKCWKLITRTISPSPSLFVARRPSTYSQGNLGKFWGDWRWGGDDPLELDSSLTLKRHERHSYIGRIARSSFR